ncbi:hypothetical protein [Eubacterium uniforme]|nr:hypothetical protein [Eubacterium uniforme]
MDKTLPYIRYEIAKFENEKFETKLNRLLEAINDEKKWGLLECEILDSIKAYTFPKKICSEKTERCEPIVISNVCSDSVCVEKYNNFIDLSIEGHILSVLWILLVGYKIDKNLPDNCFGKRLCDKLIFSEGRVSESPSLFKPYYRQYVTWRNQGLISADNVVNQENQSVIITMLDLNRYYYNIDYTDSKFKRVTNVGDNSSDEIIKINNLMYKIMQRYSEILGIKNRIILPIGFLPSNILSNSYLIDFDDKANKCKNTVYYGRYVDDMILVSRVEPHDKLKSKITKNGVSEVSSYILKKLETFGLIECKDKETISLSEYDGLDIQKDKIRFFYVDKSGYDTIIKKIEKDIAQNTSEFNYLPEDSNSMTKEDILQFERVDTVNKLRSLNGVSIDKYVLSKAIGKNVMMAPFVEKETVDSFVNSIDQLLDYKEILNNYTQWEGVLNYYIINRKWVKVIDFTAKVVSALSELDEESSKIGEYSYLNNRGIYSVGDTLVKYYIACLTRSMAIVWGKNIQEILEKISLLLMKLESYSVFENELSIRSINKLRRYYCNSRMVNSNLLPISLEECMNAFELNDNAEKEICFYEIDEYFNSDCYQKYLKKNKKYKPYISSPFEILYTSIIKSIKENKIDLLDDNYWVDYMCKKYVENFNKSDQLYLKKYIEGKRIDSEGNIIINEKNEENNVKNGKYRIAVANVRMQESDFQDILSGKKRNISKRCNEISKIVNEAIRYSSDVLVFPEAYIPITFLPVIQKKAALHNMIVIGGIEHIRNGDYVYNLTVTLLPIVNSDMRYIVPFFHPKVYYSPEEESMIKKYKCIPIEGKGHTLFRWKNLSFVTFCCYELTSLEERCKFKREADIVFGVEWNKDTKYFSNIIEALSRDRCCFCAQSNMSEYGDSRIVQPTKNEIMNIARVKGGINGTVIIDEIDVAGLRKHIKSPSKNGGFKPLPAGY